MSILIQVHKEGMRGGSASAPFKGDAGFPGTKDALWAAYRQRVRGRIQTHISPEQTVNQMFTSSLARIELWSARPASFPTPRGHSHTHSLLHSYYHLPHSSPSDADSYLPSLPFSCASSSGVTPCLSALFADAEGGCGRCLSVRGYLLEPTIGAAVPRCRS